MQGLYETIIKNKQGQILANLTGAENHWWTRELNGPGGAGFTISPLDPKITADLLRPGEKELYFIRAGTVVWGGEITTRRTDVGTDDAGVITVTAKGFLSLFAKKLIGTIASPETFSADDLSDIAEAIRDGTQSETNASLGVSAGSYETSRNGDRTYKFDAADEALLGLSNKRVQNGIDIVVDHNKQLSTFYPRKGRDLENVVFEWGVNIVGFFYIDDATDMANQVIVIGEEDGVSTPVVTRNAPTYIQELYGIRQAKISRAKVSETSTLAEWGDKELERCQQGRQQLGIVVKGNKSPGIGSYDIGDRVRVRINYGIDDIDALYRITKISVQKTSNDEETVTIQFGDVDDLGGAYNELEERIGNLETAA